MGMPEPQKFRMKPLEVEAMRWIHDRPQSAAPILSWIRENGGEATFVAGAMEPMIRITTSEGLIHAFPGDWVIRGADGGFQPCRPHVFVATYDRVD